MRAISVFAHRTSRIFFVVHNFVGPSASAIETTEEAEGSIDNFIVRGLGSESFVAVTGVSQWPNFSKVQHAGRAGLALPSHIQTNERVYVLCAYRGGEDLTRRAVPLGMERATRIVTSHENFSM